MKIRAYYGETDAYNYIRFVLGNKYMTFFDIINDIDICRENISEIVDSIKFDEWDYSDFIDCYEGVKNNRNRNESDVAESAVEIDEDSSRIVSGADNSNDNLSDSNSELEKATATVPLSTDDFAVLEAPQEENSSNQAD